LQVFFNLLLRAGFFSVSFCDFIDVASREQTQTAIFITGISQGTFFCASRKMLWKKASSMYIKEEKKEKKRSRHIAIALLMLHRRYFLTAENGEYHADEK